VARREADVLATTFVALKMGARADVDVAAIREEAQVWVRASGHANVLPIIDADVYGDYAVIASEYVAEGSLAQWLERHGGRAPSVGDAMVIIDGILAGLDHLHSCGVIHRDLKPANVLLQRGVPRIADFGISRFVKSDQGTARTNVIVGTPEFMAPEAFAGVHSAQTDIWAAGVLSYLLLTGRFPIRKR
jgi:serine/threonine-protein kinase